jgi:tRNA 5-methylaminomethyl-2-thiouridine biosynthesis bifunctional protein
MHHPGQGPALDTADIEWDERGVPRSRRFGDVYFSQENGLEETRYVFLAQNRLEQRFRALKPGQSFVIAETGFGTGLNLLAAWHLWQQTASPEAILHFVSVERYPLNRDDLARALSYWPELAPLADELKASYPPSVTGLHRVRLAGGRVRLSLYFGDILDAWQDMAFTADAWFLDGFAPSLNPEMWLDQALGQLRSHSRPGTTLATFTAVGRIRRALAEHGFAMEKVPGFGRKREMLAGELPPDPDAAIPERPREVTIVGAGIAGCLLARNLAERGIEVTLLDQSGPGAGASGNRQGALYVKPGVEYNDQTRLAISALLFSQRYYAASTPDQWHPTGLVLLASDAREADRQGRFLRRNRYPDELLRPVSSAEASGLAGVPVPHGGLWFPGSGWLQPAELCEELLGHPRIKCRVDFAVRDLQPEADGWTLQSDTGAMTASHLVLCTGHLTPELMPEGDHYRFKAIRGQVSYLQAENTSLPQVVLCGHRYINPSHAGISVTGATFDLKDPNPDLTEDSHRENMTVLKEMLPDFQIKNEPQLLDGRVCFRCTTHDYQPVAGVMESDQHPDLTLFTGLGSKGLSYAPLLAEFLADRLSGQPEALPLSLSKRLNSERCRRPER